MGNTTSISYRDMIKEFDLFLEIHCDVDEKLHMPISEFHAAFYEFLQKKEFMPTQVSFRNMMKINDDLIRRRNFKIKGFKTDNHPCGFSFVVGVKLRSFP